MRDTLLLHRTISCFPLKTCANDCEANGNYFEFISSFMTFLVDQCGFFIGH